MSCDLDGDDEGVIKKKDGDYITIIDVDCDPFGDVTTEAWFWIVISLAIIIFIAMVIGGVLYYMRTKRN